MRYSDAFMRFGGLGPVEKAAAHAPHPRVIEIGGCGETVAEVESHDPAASFRPSSAVGKDELFSPVEKDFDESDHPRDEGGKFSSGGGGGAPASRGNAESGGYRPGKPGEGNLPANAPRADGLAYVRGKTGLAFHESPNQNLAENYRSHQANVSAQDYPKVRAKLAGMGWDHREVAGSKTKYDEFTRGGHEVNLFPPDERGVAVVAYRGLAGGGRGPSVTPESDDARERRERNPKPLGSRDAADARRVTRSGSEGPRVA